jgi:hypothetical protein
LANLIGGTTAATRNVISGNTADGVDLSGSLTEFTSLQGNDIGTAADGTSNLGNGDRGVFIQTGANDNAVGGVAAGAGNIIAFNHDDGVLVGRNVSDPLVLNAGAGNVISENSIFSNVRLGIELGQDTGVPASQNASGLVLNSPTLSSASAGRFFLTVNGNWQSDSFTQGIYRIEVFSNTVADGSGHGQGKVFVGAQSISVSTNSTDFSISLGDAFASGQVISCTITDPFNNTSEFSNEVTMS